MRLSISIYLAMLLISQPLASTLKPGIDYMPNLIEFKLTAEFNRTVNKASDGHINYPTGNKSIDVMMQKYNIKQLKPIFTFDPISLKSEHFWALGMDRYYLFRSGLSKPSAFGSETVLDVSTALKSLTSLIEEADPAAIYQPCYTPNDWTIQSNPYSPGDPMWGLDSMHCPQAWDYWRGDPNSNPVLVVTIDTGVDLYHEDLVANFKVNTAEDLNHNGRYDENDLNGIDDDGNGFVDDVVGYDFVDNDTYWLSGVQNVPGEDYSPRDGTPMDFNGHGTHVCGTVAAHTDNTVGVPSASYSVNTIAVRAALACRLNGTNNLTARFVSSDVAPAIQYAVNRGARVLSLSFGGSSTSHAQEVALGYAHHQGNCLPFAAAGNDNTSNSTYPADYPEVLKVAALSFGNVKADYSNYSSNVAVCAPGDVILSTTVRNSYNVNNGYGLSSGTSMACPNAAAVAGFILSMVPTLDHDTLGVVMMRTGHDPSQWNNSSYNGMLGKLVDAAAAIRSLRPLGLTSPVYDSLTLTVGNALVLQWTSVPSITTTRVEINRNYPTGAWQVICGNAPNTGSAVWIVDGIAGDHMRFRVLDADNPSQNGDTTRVDSRVMAQRQLPLIENFSLHSFPPPGWTIVPTPEILLSGWSRYDGNNGNNGVASCPTNYSVRRRYELWSQSFSTIGVSAVTVRFKLSCSLSGNDQLDDSLMIAYEANPQLPYQVAAVKRTRGTGDEWIFYGTGGDVNTPASSDWGTWEVQLPNFATQSSSVRIGLLGTNYRTDRPNFFIDDFEVQPFALVVGPSMCWYTALTGNSVSLAWDNLSNNETGFLVQRSTDGVNFVTRGTTNPNVTSFTDNTLIPGTMYYYRVFALSGTMQSTRSAALTLTSPPAIPLAPILGNVGTTMLELTPRNAANNANNPGIGYMIYVLDDQNNWWVQGDNTLGYTPVALQLSEWGTRRITGLTPGHTVQIGVHATTTDHVSSAMSPTVTAQLVTAWNPPLVQNFGTTDFPPWDWELRGSNAERMDWEPYRDSVEQYSAAVFRCYEDNIGNRAGELVSPPMELGEAAAIRLTFQISYTPRAISGNDSLIVYAFDNVLYTRTPLITLATNGSGLDGLTGGSGGTPGMPAPRSTWRTIEKTFLANQLPISSFQFEIYAKSAQGSNIYFSELGVYRDYPPGSPSNAYVDNRFDTRLRVSWVDQSYNETSFILNYSTDNSTWSPDFSVAANETTHTFNSLQAAQQYYFRIRADLNGLSSETFAAASGWTLPSIPNNPMSRFAGCMTVTIQPVNSLAVPNSSLAEYNIQELTTNRFVQSDGTLGMTAVWQTLEQWTDSVVVRDLFAYNSYQFATSARNPNGDVAAMPSVPLTMMTRPLFQLPLSRDFSTDEFPPPLWEIENPNDLIGWERLTGFNCNNGVAIIEQYHNSELGDRDILWTPFINMTTADSAQFSFRWSYTRWLNFNDSLQVIVQDQYGVSWILLTMSALGSGADSLPSGFGGSAQLPANAGTWRQAVINIPPGIFAQRYLRFGIVAISQYGANIYIDDIAVDPMLQQSPGEPTNVTISYTNPNAVIYWQAPSFGTVTGYRIYRSNTGYFTPPSVGTLIGATTATVHEFTITNVRGQYYYRVTSINGTP